MHTYIHKIAHAYTIQYIYSITHKHKQLSFLSHLTEMGGIYFFLLVCDL